MSDLISEDCSGVGVFFVAGFAEQRLDQSRPARSLAGPAAYRRPEPGGPPSPFSGHPIRARRRQEGFINRRLVLLPKSAHAASSPCSNDVNRLGSQEVRTRLAVEPGDL
jgi:hypothetical protein